MRRWTVLLYLAGADDLEPYLTRTLLALEEAGPPPDVEVLVQLTRSPLRAILPLLPGRQPTGIDGDWHGTRRYRLRRRPGGAPRDRIASELLEDLGEVSPADPNVLAEFVELGLAHCPAERSLLVISGHGMGFVGVTLDLVTGPLPTTMTIRSVAAALRRLGRRPDLLLLDACQMNSLDVLAQFAQPRPAAEVVITPASHAPRAGLDYSRMLPLLDDAPTEQVAARLAAALQEAAGLQVLAFRMEPALWAAVTRGARDATGPTHLPMYAAAARACIHPAPGSRLRLLVTWPNPDDFPERYQYLYRRLQFARQSGWGRWLAPAGTKSPVRGEALRPLPVPAPLLEAWLRILRSDLSSEQATALISLLQWT